MATTDAAKLRTWVRFSGRDRDFQRYVFEVGDEPADEPADDDYQIPSDPTLRSRAKKVAVSERRLVFYEMHDDSTKTKVREERLETHEAFDQDEFVEILCLCGWPEKSIRVYIKNPNVSADKGKDYLASKRFYPPLEYKDKQAKQTEQNALVQVIEPETVQEKLITRWNTPEGAEAIVTIVDRILHSIGPLIVETVRDSEQARYDAKLNYERQSAEIRARVEYQTSQASAGRGQYNG